MSFGLELRRCNGNQCQVEHSQNQGSKLGLSIFWKPRDGQPEGIVSERLANYHRCPPNAVIGSYFYKVPGILKATVAEGKAIRLCGCYLSAGSDRP